MAELGTAAIGAGAALGAAVYTAATGFVARHESVHSLQVTEIRRHITDFEGAYGRGEVTEEDWGIYLAIRAEARQKESEYEESIATYKETPTYHFVTKWNKKRQVRQKKKALQKANRSLRLHYYEATSEASDASSVTAVSGSPPRSCRAHSDEDDRDKRILSWAEDVANSDSDGLDAGPSSNVLHDRRRIDRVQRRCHELREAYENLKDTLPHFNKQMVAKPDLLHRATEHILDLEGRNKELRERIVQEEAELERLRLFNRLHTPAQGGNNALRDAYTNLKDTLPYFNNQMVTKLTLINRATEHILDLEERNKELRERVVQEEAELERLRLFNRFYTPNDSNFSPGG